MFKQSPLRRFPVTVFAASSLLLGAFRTAEAGVWAGSVDHVAPQAPVDLLLPATIEAAAPAENGKGQELTDRQAALVLGFDDYPEQAARAYRYINAKEPDKALETLAALELKSPDNPGIANLRGLAYLGMGDTSNARASFEKALKLRPTLVYPAIQLAQLDLAAKDVKAAKGRYTSILERDSANIPAMIGLAEVDQRQGNEDAFVDWLKRAAAVSPTAVAPRLMLAAHFAKKGDLTRALISAKEAADGRPSSAGAWALLGQLQMQNGQPGDASASFERWAALAPNSAEAQFWLAKARIALRNDSSARDALFAALALEPNRVDALRALYDLEKRGGDAVAADRIAKQIKDLGVDADTGGFAKGVPRIVIEGAGNMTPEQVQRAVAAAKPSLVAIKQHRDTVGVDAQAADAALLGWLEKHPDDRLARVYLADSFLKRQNDQAAIAQYEVALKQVPQDPLLLNNLAVLYQKTGDPRSIEIARQVYNLDPANSSYTDTLGWILVQQGKTAEGLKLLNQAARAAPGDADIRLHLAEALLSAGDASGARAELDRLGRLKLDATVAKRREALLERIDAGKSGRGTKP